MSKLKTANEAGPETKQKRTRSKQRKNLVEPEQENALPAIQEQTPVQEKTEEKQSSKPFEKIKSSFTYKSSISHL